MSLIIECRDIRASSIVEAAWDGSEIDGWTISAKQMLASDLEGITINPHEESNHDKPFNPSMSCLSSTDMSNAGCDHRVRAEGRDRSSRSYQPYRRPQGQASL